MLLWTPPPFWQVVAIPFAFLPFVETLRSSNPRANSMGGARSHAWRVLPSSLPLGCRCAPARRQQGYKKHEHPAEIVSAGGHKSGKQIPHPVAKARPVRDDNL